MNYLEVLMNCFPDAQAYTRGDPTIYEDIIWVSSPISKVTIEGSSCASPNYLRQTTGRSIRTWYGSILSMSGNTVLASTANSTPLITGGTQAWNKEVMLLDTKHKAKISSTFIIDGSRSNVFAAAIFRDDVCICSSMTYITGSAKPQTMALVLVDDVETTLIRTYSMRVGFAQPTTGTWYINQLNNGAQLGSMTANQCFIIEELEQ